MKKKIFYLLSLILIVYVGFFSSQKVKSEQPVQIKVEATPIPTPTPDIRVKKLEKFFTDYHSPLASSAADFIELSDSYGFDYRLLVAIAGAESTFETKGNTHDFNPFGLLCTHAAPCASFGSFRDAIHTLAGTLRNHRAYADFRKTGKTEELARAYMAGDQKRWVETIEYFINQLGKEEL